MKAVKTWPINEDGHVILTTGSGSANIAGYVMEDYIPVDEDGRMVVVFDVSPSSGGSSTVTAADITDSSATGRTVLTGTASTGRTALGLGTAATQDSSAFATPTDVANLAAVVQPKVGVPSAFTSRTLTNSDDGDTLVCASAQVATVDTGLMSGFGCVFKGAITFSGTATVTDERSTGATYPWCALVQTGTDTYAVVGGKA